MCGVVGLSTTTPHATSNASGVNVVVIVGIAASRRQQRSRRVALQQYPTNRRSARRGRTPELRNRSQRRQAVAVANYNVFVANLSLWRNAANVSRRLSRATVGRYDRQARL